MTFRIQIQELKNNGKHKHIKDIYVDTLEDIEKIETFTGYLKYATRKSKEAYDKQKEKEITDFIHSDLFDLKSKGKDTTEKGYYLTETQFYTIR